MLPLTQDEQKIIKILCNQVWNEISSDLLENAGNEILPRETVIECVLDCDRLESAAYRSIDHREAIKALRSLSVKTRNKFLSEFVFPHKLYS